VIFSLRHLLSYALTASDKQEMKFTKYSSLSLYPKVIKKKIKKKRKVLYSPA